MKEGQGEALEALNLYLTELAEADRLEAKAAVSTKRP
jgi:hypothetical protein